MQDLLVPSLQKPQKYDDAFTIARHVGSLWRELWIKIRTKLIHFVYDAGHVNDLVKTREHAKLYSFR